MRRSSISLGSKLCSNEDIKRRSILANLAFQNYKKVWEQGKRIPLKTRLKIYEAQVVSVLMYNCSCWAASKQLLNKLDICHRKHLRQIIRMTYPNIIKNDTLYNFTRDVKWFHSVSVLHRHDGECSDMSFAVITTHLHSLHYTLQ